MLNLHRILGTRYSSFTNHSGTLRDQLDIEFNGILLCKKPDRVGYGEEVSNVIQVLEFVVYEFVASLAIRAEYGS